MTDTVLQKSMERTAESTQGRRSWVSPASGGSDEIAFRRWRKALVEIAAVVDPDQACVRACQEIAPEMRVCGQFDDLLTQDLDAVVIATPSALHAEQCIAAFNRGLAVFCQKPLGRTAAEVRGVVQAARRADRLLGVDLSYRWTQAALVARSIVRSGRIGGIFNVELTFFNAYGPNKPWFYDLRLAGGGCVIDLGVHLVDLALWTMGFPEIVETHSRLYNKGVLLRETAPWSRISRRRNCGRRTTRRSQCSARGISTPAAMP